MKLATPFLIPLVVLSIAAAPAFSAGAKSLEHADKVLNGAKTTLSQAISTAEAQVGGKALSARLAQHHGQSFYDIHVVKGGTLTDVRVGIDDGKIMGTHPIEHGHMAKHGAPGTAEQPANKS